mmetsp:Transcript_26481/g.50012  ORF Transcript_26481/g.50012 Transcript_26481/m.50012 type:complete len:343 (-) Transcript_26481:492-1520(-)|eukprot:CAMPEP_0114279600 /NCGR_PEP_ID=MMETSP0059-20121206/1976_1 /TAXON_ID=36894 /ORGANISM="Pyramimonas parkeae, Strain CCMP726" /LENGTH=342 /DNA_ID=CAMNT_0001399915 /DNA_START=89 /DNA_END=1117 /DNA_ORIENTATION=-
MDLLQEDDIPVTLAALLLVFNLLDKATDLPICALVCKEWHRACSHRSLWHSLQLQGASHAGRCLACLQCQPRIHVLKEVNLEFAQGIEDKHVVMLSGLQLQKLNLNACQKVGDNGVIALVKGEAGAHLQFLSLYWNLRVTDAILEAIGERCSQLTDLNLSGCKQISDVGMCSLAKGKPDLLRLNVTRCPKVKDSGLLAAIRANANLHGLILYANAMLTDASLAHISTLPNLVEVDLCGMQFVTDQALASLAACTRLQIVNLTWCIKMTDVGACAVASACPELRSLCVYGVKGVTDALVEALAKTCSQTLVTFDCRGCVGIKARSPDELLVHLPKITTFIVHS